LTGEASAEKPADAAMAYQPSVFATIQASFDKKELFSRLAAWFRTDYTLYQAGVSKLTEWELLQSFTTLATKTNIKDTNPMYVPEPSWYEAAPTLELSQPLLRTSLGSDLKNSVELQRVQGQLSALTEGP